MTMRGGTQSRWRFKRPAATHDLLIHFVRRADRLQYYDCAALSSAGRSLRELSTALKICWTLSAPSTRISGKILHGAHTAVPAPMFSAHDRVQGNVVRDANARRRLIGERLFSHQGVAGG